MWTQKLEIPHSDSLKDKESAFNLRKAALWMHFPPYVVNFIDTCRRLRHECDPRRNKAHLLEEQLGTVNYMPNYKLDPFDAISEVRTASAHSSSLSKCCNVLGLLPPHAHA